MAPAYFFTEERLKTLIPRLTYVRPEITVITAVVQKIIYSIFFPKHTNEANVSNEIKTVKS
jgi:hypothetical protein